MTGSPAADLLATPALQTAKRVRTLVGFALFTIAVGVALAMLTNERGARPDPLDPTNPLPDGARAVAQVLQDRSVKVIVARSAAELEQQPIDTATTVLATSTDRLGASTAKRLLNHSQPGDLIVVEPGSVIASELDLGVEPYGVPVSGPRRGDCADARFDELTVAVDAGIEYDLSVSCFAGEDGGLLGTTGQGTTVLGAGQILQNGQVLRADNAAVALRLLGRHPRLVWYLPDLADLSGDDGVAWSRLLPAWLRPALLLTGVAAIAVIGWRGRRLGPLVGEPTPVEVKAIETTLSRGRLYRKAGDRAHAADTLRTAARERLRARLHLPARTPPEVLIGQLAERLGRPIDQVAEHLSPDAATPTTDHQLISLANRLAELDEEVHRP
ncbi:MAG: DUF4350 domain-containing protein [Nocardioides sp.]